MTKGTALITGGAKRVGLEIAISLAKKGYTIALHYNSSKKDDVDKSISLIQSIQPDSRSYQCDLTDLPSVGKLISTISTNHPDLSLLVNNASVYEKLPIKDTETYVLERDMKVHYMAPFLLTREFAKYVKKGMIINILDARLRKNTPGNASYFISKKALMTLTEIAALELAPHIRVNAIAPGPVLPPPNKTQDYSENKAKEVPLGRLGSIGDITKGIHTFLDEDILTGQILYLDGGMYL